MAGNPGRERLGGPPGLFDSPNWDRESNGGIVQRIRVPDTTEQECLYLQTEFQTNSLNDSDNRLDIMGDKAENQSPTTSEDLKDGIPFRKSIAGRNL